MTIVNVLIVESTTIFFIYEVKIERWFCKMSMVL